MHQCSDPALIQPLALLRNHSARPIVVRASLSSLPAGQGDIGTGRDDLEMMIHQHFSQFLPDGKSAAIVLLWSRCGVALLSPFHLIRAASASASTGSWRADGDQEKAKGGTSKTVNHCKSEIPRTLNSLASGSKAFGLVKTATKDNGEYEGTTSSVLF
jgi:hypothetical protein